LGTVAFQEDIGGDAWGEGLVGGGGEEGGQTGEEPSGEGADG